jgi:hypothetical protein
MELTDELQWKLMGSCKISGEFEIITEMIKKELILQRKADKERLIKALPKEQVGNNIEYGEWDSGYVSGYNKCLEQIKRILTKGGE